MYFEQLYEVNVCGVAVWMNVCGVAVAMECVWSSCTDGICVGQLYGWMCVEQLYGWMCVEQLYGCDVRGTAVRMGCTWDSSCTDYHLLSSPPAVSCTDTRVLRLAGQDGKRDV